MGAALATLEDLGSGLGVTDPVSGPVVSSGRASSPLDADQKR
jgi:hypothetical protein